MASMDIPVGTIADATAGTSTVRGVVRFCGTTGFAPGKWVGMELSEPIGKNDGSVKGTRYFTCKMNYGIFVKFSQVKPVESPPVSLVRRLIVSANSIVDARSIISKRISSD
jgi:dynactin 1